MMWLVKGKSWRWPRREDGDLVSQKPVFVVLTQMCNGMGVVVVDVMMLCSCLSLKKLYLFLVSVALEWNQLICSFICG